MVVTSVNLFINYILCFLLNTYSVPHSFSKLVLGRYTMHYVSSQAGFCSVSICSTKHNDYDPSYFTIISIIVTTCIM